MKSGIKALALLAALSFSGAAFAADAPDGGTKDGQNTEKHERKHAGLHGKVSSVSGNNIIIKTHGDKEVTVVTDDKTKFTKDGEAATLADVTTDSFISVTPKTGTATEVKIHTRKANHKAGENK